MDRQLESQYEGQLAGVDEVGRGPWAGPVVAAACVLSPQFPEDLLQQLADSKKLTTARREKLAPLIKQHAVVSIGEASVSEIDEMNILEATFLAMRRAIDQLPLTLDWVLVDGNHQIKQLKIKQKAVIKGDTLYPSIAAASIVAKVYRDQKMIDLAKYFPYYGWESNAGYGTKKHQEGLALYGITQHHRQSFKPIQKIINQGK